MRARLLDPGRDLDLAAPDPAYRDDLSRDLELPVLLDAMGGGDRFVRDVSEKVLLAGAADPETIRYRQGALADCLAEPDVVRGLYQIAGGTLQEKRRAWGLLSSQNPSSVLTAAVSQLSVLLAGLRRLRQVADEHGGRFGSEAMVAFFTAVRGELNDAYLAGLDRHLRQLRFPDGELMSARLGRDNRGTGYVLRSGRARRSLGEIVGISARSMYSFALAPRDEAGAQALSEMVGRGINPVASAAARSADHLSGFFASLRAETGFYVGCLNLRERLAACGQPLAFPEPAAVTPAALSFTGLRDPCLALRTGAVTGNDVSGDGARLVVITGANSGGKSTFLRSVGLAQLMMHSGMFVTATAFRASICAGVLTHFIREEDPALTRGRLDEELARMSVIADQVSTGSMVLLNESFAATSEREGAEIGRQVITALTEAGVRVLLVTHNYELASSFGARGPGQVLFLRAPRQPGGYRDFMLVSAPPLPTSHGADIYDRIGGWLGES